MGGLVVMDLGWFSFPFFAALTEASQYFVTRLRRVSGLGLSYWRVGDRKRGRDPALPHLALLRGAEPPVRSRRSCPP